MHLVFKSYQRGTSSKGYERPTEDAYSGNGLASEARRQLNNWNTSHIKVYYSVHFNILTRR